MVQFNDSELYRGVGVIPSTRHNYPLPGDKLARLICTKVEIEGVRVADRRAESQAFMRSPEFESFHTKKCFVFFQCPQ